ncbi:hypothetical protein [Wohlfahrtiimonas populi]|uniref:hypothetical protein n=1 Tax=Wohlfahrtiimonas populi TaxID=1940240 RepID=UPI00098D228F|nr:hypothetical protein [Wohlfahrtiimonas populi]
MGILKDDPRWGTEDLYICYDFEEVMYRWSYIDRKQYQKFYNGPNNQEQEVPYNQRLFTDAIMYGEEITKEEYEQGKLKSE